MAGNVRGRIADSAIHVLYAEAYPGVAPVWYPGFLSAPADLVLITWPESKVVMRFWIISLVLSLFALSTLKLR